MPVILNETQQHPEQVLIIRLSALGDVLHCLPALEALRQLWPGTAFDWVTESLSASVIAGHPDIRQIYMLPRKDWRGRLRRSASQWVDVLEESHRFGSELRRRRYPLLIDLQGNIRSMTLALCASYESRVCHHPTEVKEHSWLFPGRHPPSPAGLVHRVHKNLHLVRALGWQGRAPPGKLPDYREEMDRLTREPEMKGPRPVVLHPFVSPFGRFKEWPGELYADLARRLSAAGYRVMLSWDQSGLEAAQHIAELSGGTAELAPRTPSPRYMAALIGLSRALVAADTGAVHLAALLGIPVVALFGPKDPTRYGPWSSSGRSLVATVPCSPCTLRRCEHSMCMQSIRPDQVAREVHELLLGLQENRAPQTVGETP